MAWHFGGKVAKCDHREYGCAKLRISNFDDTEAESSLHALFEGMGEEVQVFDHNAQLSCTFLDDSLGLDVSRRPTSGETTWFSGHRSYGYSSVCSHLSRSQAVLRHSIPPRGHTLASRERGHQPFRGQHLRLSAELDNGRVARIVLFLPAKILKLSFADRVHREGDRSDTRYLWNQRSRYWSRQRWSGQHCRCEVDARGYW